MRFWTGLISTTQSVEWIKVHHVLSEEEKSWRVMIVEKYASPSRIFHSCAYFFFLFSKMNPSKLYVTEWEFKCFTFSERIHTRKLRHWRRILFRLHAHRLLLQPDFHCTFMQFEYACAKGSTWATIHLLLCNYGEEKKSN